MIKGLLPTMLVGALGGLLGEALRVLPALREGKGPRPREYLVSGIYVAIGASAALYGWDTARRAIDVAVLGAAFPLLFAAGVRAAVPEPEDHLVEVLALQSQVNALNKLLEQQRTMFDQLLAERSREAKALEPEQQHPGSRERQQTREPRGDEPRQAREPDGERPEDWWSPLRKEGEPEKLATRARRSEEFTSTGPAKLDQPEEPRQTGGKLDQPGSLIARRSGKSTSGRGERLRTLRDYAASRF